MNLERAFAAIGWLMAATLTAVIVIQAQRPVVLTWIEYSADGRPIATRESPRQISISSHPRADSPRIVRSDDSTDYVWRRIRWIALRSVVCAVALLVLVIFARSNR